MSNGITAKYNILHYVVAIPIIGINDGVFSSADNSTEKKPICSFCTHDKVLSQFYPIKLVPSASNFVLRIEHMS